MTAEMILEDFFANCDGFLLAQFGKTKGIVCLLRTLNNERRCFIIELISVYPDPPFICFFKDKRKGIIEFLMSAKPDKLAKSFIDIWLKNICVFVSGSGI